MSEPSGSRLSPPSCRTDPALADTVASAWQSQIAQEVLAGQPVVTRRDPTSAEPDDLARGAVWPDVLLDYALLGLAASVAIASMLFVIARASLATDVLLAVVSVVLMIGGHGVLRARRRARAAEGEAHRARHDVEVRHVLAESEARRQRLVTFSKLAAEIAHEVRNPLGSIVLNTELLEEELHACIHASPEVKRLARAIGAEAERLAVLTNEYLTFARLPQPSAEPQVVGDLLDEVACFMRADATRRHVAIEVQADPGACAHADPRLVRQALLGLVRNALEAVPEGGRIDLRAGVDASRVSVDVIDSGPGVPAGMEEAVFEPFVSTKPQGTGLGLAVARRVALDHGGDLRLMPSSQGAWFRLELPVGSSPTDQPTLVQRAIAGGLSV